MIDVIIPVWNGADYLDQAIASVLCQTYSDWRMYVMDNGSEDETPEIIARWQAIDWRIKGFRLDRNYGSRVTRNMGAAKGNGEFMIHLDHDDMISPDFMQATLNHIGDHAYCYVDSVRMHVKTGKLQLHKLPDFSVDWLRSNPEGHQSFGPLVNLVRRGVFERAGGYDPKYPAAENWVLNVKMAINGDYGVHLARHLFWHRFGKDSGHWKTCAPHLDRTRLMMKENYPEFFKGVWE